MKACAASKVIFIIIWALFLCGSSAAYAADYTDCIKCHVAKPDLKKKYIHPAIQMGCKICHADAHKKGGGNPLGLSSEVPKLCFNCHGNKAFKGKVVHPPVASGMCTFCHDPHSSGNEHLLRAKVPKLCYECHGKFDNKVVHAPVAAGMCLSCHTPHTGPYEALLSKPLNGLCLQCHENVVRAPHADTFGKGHPLFIKNDPKHPGHEFTCVSCHNPHDSKWIKLFKYKVIDPDGFELCGHCHKV
ncbi:MAG: cytochrome c3 family protein [Candidatus Sulfobium sp.]|jgi:predicted CXXCH cytochrome family protein